MAEIIVQDAIQAFVNNPGNARKVLEEVFETAVTKAVAAERERCARVCNDIAEDCKQIAEHSAVLAALRCAAAIRKGEGE